VEQTLTPEHISGNSLSGAPKKQQWISWKWTFVLIVLLFGYFAWQCGSGMNAGAQLSDEAVRHFHSQLDSAAYGNILAESDDAFQNSAKADEITRFLTGVHNKLGKSHSFARTNIFVNASTGGTYIKVTYNSTFDQGPATEAFTWKKTAGRLKLVRYDINSNVFITQ
jgi:hypothetical protein